MMIMVITIIITTFSNVHKLDTLLGSCSIIHDWFCRCMEKIRSNDWRLSRCFNGKKTLWNVNLCKEKYQLTSKVKNLDQSESFRSDRNNSDQSKSFRSILNLLIFGYFRPEIQKFKQLLLSTVEVALSCCFITHLHFFFHFLYATTNSTTPKYHKSSQLSLWLSVKWDVILLFFYA